MAQKCRRNIMKRKKININDITIPTNMRHPKEYKILGMTEYKKKYKHYEGYVIVNKNNKLIDGYVIYCVAKDVFKQKTVTVIEVSTLDRIKHLFRRLVKKFEVKNN